MAHEDAPLWDRIYRTRLWTLVHSYNSAVLGWLVLVVNRHLETVAELSDDESEELGRLIRLTSLALREIIGCQKTYVVQFAEHPLHPHVHFHIIARNADLPPEKRGTHIFDFLGVPEEQRVSKEAMNALALRVRVYMTQHYQALPVSAPPDIPGS